MVRVLLAAPGHVSMCASRKDFFTLYYVRAIIKETLSGDKSFNIGAFLFIPELNRGWGGT